MPKSGKYPLLAFFKAVKTPFSKLRIIFKVHKPRQNLTPQMILCFRHRAKFDSLIKTGNVAKKSQRSSADSVTEIQNSALCKNSKNFVQSALVIIS